MLVIPLVGCMVQLVAGKHHSEQGVVSMVIDYKTRLRALSEDEAFLFVRAQRARFGDEWVNVWFEATVTLDSGTMVENVAPGDFNALTPHMLRSKKYKAL